MLRRRIDAHLALVDMLVRAVRVLRHDLRVARNRHLAPPMEKAVVEEARNRVLKRDPLASRAREVRDHPNHAAAVRALAVLVSVDPARAGRASHHTNRGNQLVQVARSLAMEQKVAASVWLNTSNAKH